MISSRLKTVYTTLICLLAISAPSRAAEEFRPVDTRPILDDRKLAALGVLRYESKRLVLYTDVSEDFAREILPIADASYEALEEYFGKMPPAKDGADYQLTGYVLRDRQLFREAGLAPKDLPPFLNGRHRGQEFWVNVPGENYYLKHLIVHEATHCFMTLMPNTNSPVWYLEGMAELFGLHRVSEEGDVEFRIMPEPDEFDILRTSGRIKLMQLQIRERGGRTLNEVLAFDSNAFLDNEAYVWSWGLCKFLDAHPRYCERFRELRQHRGFQEFADAMRGLFERDAGELQTEWIWFTHGICPGYDFERAAVKFRDGAALARGEKRTTEIRADRGWQSSAVKLEAGRKYRVTASGRFTLGATPRPWVSESQGITYRYNQGQPLGRLLGVVHTNGSASPDADNSDSTTKREMMPIVSIGKESTFTASADGTLYLRLNDAFSSLDDNTGTAEVVLEEIAEP